MKEEIIKYFKTDRSYASGLKLIIRYSNRLSLKKQLNIHQQSDYLAGVINEELRELAGLTPDGLEDILLRPIVKTIPDEQLGSSSVEPIDTETLDPENTTVPPEQVKKSGRKR